MQDTADFSVAEREHDGVQIVELAGEIDLGNAEVAASAVAALVRPETTAVVLDLAGLSFIDLAGTRALLRVTGAAGSRRALVAQPGSAAATLLELGGFAGEVPVHGSLEDALGGLLEP